MKFAFQEIHDLTDAQRNFEQITAHGIDDATTLGGALKGTLPNPAFAASALAQLGIARGGGSVTFTAATTSNIVTVAHGLPGTPTTVLGSVTTNPFGAWFPTSSYTSTTFDIQGLTTSAVSLVVNFGWIAVL